ncbi:MAG TPA: rRNA maturation RNase YbeY [Candidatus Paceibacterota bacterium]|jgi:probable rRNA maturation factor
MTGLDIRNFTRSPLPRLPFADAVKELLPTWNISLVLAGETRAQSLNVALRGKDYVPNVLSYAVGNKSGEVILCPAVSKREAQEFGHTEREHLLYLFIHGLLHLKGLRHGATMEDKERELTARMIKLPSNSNGTTHSNRNRYRNSPNEGRRRRGT